LLNAFPSYTELQHAWLDCSLILRAQVKDPATRLIYESAWGLTAHTIADHAAMVSNARAAASDPFPTAYIGFAGQADAIRHYDSRADLHRVMRPTLVLVGAEDTLTPVSQAAEMAALIPDSCLQVLPRGGHRMVQEYPEETLAAIMTFLDAT
jgi:pimeloyl-ACP methyl ester carboxylesterase